MPLEPEERSQIKLSDEWRYAALAEAVEAWGFGAIQVSGERMSRAEVAHAWFTTSTSRWSRCCAKPT